MPFDALPDNLVSDLVRLRIVRDGVATNWATGELGVETDNNHCLIGWLLVATEWDEAEATRLALEYLHPVLPKRSQRGPGIASIMAFNDELTRNRVLKLVDDGIARAGG